MKAGPPRYRQIADHLRSQIAEGRYRPGDQIPTEMELCTEHDISRHTARDALRLLTDDGLIERRRGAGSIVLATAAPAFAQPIGDFDTLLQYARDARFEVGVDQPATDDHLERVGLVGRYHQYMGFRGVAGQAPQAITAVYVRSDVAPDRATVNELSGPISEWIETAHGVSVASVTQRMEAVALDPDQAKRLAVEPGSPALRTVRRYRDAAGDVTLLSESLHPAGRFAYEMKLERTR
ncbi:MAG: GntR family transcriptional regulator [Pseudomonadota bacterium]